MPNDALATPPRVLLNERLCKQLVHEYYRRVAGGERQKVVLRAMINEVYAQGVAAGRSGVP